MYTLIRSTSSFPYSSANFPYNSATYNSAKHYIRIEIENNNITLYPSIKRIELEGDMRIVAYAFMQFAKKNDILYSFRFYDGKRIERCNWQFDKAGEFITIYNNLLVNQEKLSVLT